MMAMPMVVLEEADVLSKNTTCSHVLDNSSDFCRFCDSDVVYLSLNCALASLVCAGLESAPVSAPYVISGAYSMSV